jgi:plastocyanin
MRVVFASMLGFAMFCAAMLLASADAGEKEKKKGRAVTVHIIKMTAGNKFDPDSVDIKAGDQVTFLNDSNAAHTATSDDIKTGDPLLTFNTGTLASKGQTATLTFNHKSGTTLKYHCFVHGTGMSGTINVN